MGTTTDSHLRSTAFAPILALCCLFVAFVACTSDASKTGSPTAASTPAPTSATSDADRALALVLDLVDGVLTSDCPSEHQPCVRPDDQVASSVARGIASFEVGDPSGGGGYRLVLARDAHGQWAYWVSTQQDYEPFALPGPMRVCSDGGSADVHESPDPNANVVGSLDDETLATGEQFILTGPGVFKTSTKGHGWYRISAPIEGWVYSGEVYNTALPYECSVLRQGSEGSG